MVAAPAAGARLIAVLPIDMVAVDDEDVLDPPLPLSCTSNANDVEGGTVPVARKVSSPAAMALAEMNCPAVTA